MSSRFGEVSVYSVCDAFPAAMAVTVDIMMEKVPTVIRQKTPNFFK